MSPFRETAVVFASGVPIDVASHRCGDLVPPSGVDIPLFGRATDPKIKAVFHDKSLRRAVIEHVNHSRL